MPVKPLRAIGSGDVELAGGKAASLGELIAAGLPVPDGFVVTADTYRTFLQETGIEDDLFAALDGRATGEATSEAVEAVRDLIRSTDLPESVRSAILGQYDELGGRNEASVAVRSSATAEDLPDASFAGQQETYLNVGRDELLDRVKDCWASLFTERSIHYREEQGFDHREVNIAVVVQEMVDAEKSGVLFTSHPSNRTDEMIIEGAWGLGEAVVSGEVTPDNYVVDRTDASVVEHSVETKRTMHVRDPETGKTTAVDVPEEKRDERVLSDAELESLVELGRTIEAHYGDPQDVEWAIHDGEVYVLQSRPITTLAGPRPGDTEEDADEAAAETAEDAPDEDDDGYLLTGIGAAPGIVTGRARIVREIDQLDKVEEGDVIVTEMTTPDMVTAMQRAAGIVTDEGGLTSHAAIVSRELQVPAVVGSGDATTVVDDGQPIRIDGSTGLVTKAPETDADEDEDEGATEEAASTGTAPAAAGGPPAHTPITATDVKVNVSLAAAADRAADTGADGVGLLRTEHMVLSLGKTPAQYVADHGEDAYTQVLTEDLQKVADAFYPRPVRVRTLDAPTDEFRTLEGGEDEPHEHNPMLGYRGVRRSLDQGDLFELELAAFERLYSMGYDNVQVMFPLVTDAEDALAAKSALRDAGIDPDKRRWGVMIETPASALSVEGICETGVDFVSLGTNDLTQYTLAVDRNNERVAGRYEELHPAVLELIRRTISTCRDHGVDTSLCGQAGSDPQMVKHLVDEGITSVSVDIDAVADIRREIRRLEQKYILESVRD